MRRICFLLMMLISGLAINAQSISFKADIDEMSPMAYPPRNGLTDFTFEMRNDSAFVHLPYMGEVYTPAMSNDGLNFDAPCKNLEIKQTRKKDGRTIMFSVKHDIVVYQFNVTLFDNNRISIFLQPSNAQTCSYSGYWE